MVYCVYTVNSLTIHHLGRTTINQLLHFIKITQLQGHQFTASLTTRNQDVFLNLADRRRAVPDGGGCAMGCRTAGLSPSSTPPSSSGCFFSFAVLTVYF